MGKIQGTACRVVFGINVLLNLVALFNEPLVWGYSSPRTTGAPVGPEQPVIFQLGGGFCAGGQMGLH